jgi:tetratricopeptide repeat protein
LTARTRLAAAYDAAGQMGAALQQHQVVCAGYERVFGADHPGTLARRADLAHAYWAAGQLGEAVLLLREAIARSEQALSPGDPLSLALRQALAGITGEITAP